ncbi:MAG: hypothetical protein GY832_21965 [Chloroflexi bacterium]|nr:hypothetical protein [Chloroflexota bacterium]
MRQAQANKCMPVLTPQAIATNATSSSYIDTLGFGALRIDISTIAATATNSSAQWTSMVVLEGTTTAIASGTAISSLTGTTNTTATTAQFVLPINNDTAAGQTVSIDIDTTDLQRYIHVKVQAAKGYGTVCMLGQLYRPHTAPDAAGDWGTGSIIACYPGDNSA